MLKQVGYRRLMVAGALLLVILIACLAIWNEAISRKWSGRFDERKAYWTSAANSGVKPGEPRDEAERWLRKVSGQGGVDSGGEVPQRRQLSAIVERIPVEGWRFPCSEWVISIEVEIGPDDRVISRKVGQSGVCV